jgi:hypothetical protein
VLQVAVQALNGLLAAGWAATACWLGCLKYTSTLAVAAAAALCMRVFTIAHRRRSA